MLTINHKVASYYKIIPQASMKLLNVSLRVGQWDVSKGGATDHLNPIPGTHMVREENRRLEVELGSAGILFCMHGHTGTHTKELNVKLLNVRFMPTKFYCKGQHSSMGEQILITLKNLGSISQSHKKKSLWSVLTISPNSSLHVLPKLLWSAR